MPRQYFSGLSQDPILTPIAGVAPGTTQTSLLSTLQSNRYLPIPFAQAGPSTGQVFHFVIGGLVTTVAGTYIFEMYFGPGTSSTAFGVALATSSTITATGAYTNGSFRIEGDLIFRVIGETVTGSTVWCQGSASIGAPSATTALSTVGNFSCTAGISVDTTGTASAGTFGALNCTVLPNTTGSSFTPEFAWVIALN